MTIYNAVLIFKQQGINLRLKIISKVKDTGITAIIKSQQVPEQEDNIIEIQSFAWLKMTR